MKRTRGLHLVAGVLFLAGCTSADEPPPVAEEVEEAASAYTTVSFPSDDGLQVTADLYQGAGISAPTVILFHQSASSRAEFQTVGPRLAGLGYNALAVDLRWGGTWLGVRNETAHRNGTDTILANVEAGTGSPWPTIEAAYADMRAARRWLSGQGFSGRVFALGSSFSAMYVFRLAMDEELDGVIAYSPGEYDDARPTLVRDWARRLDIPALVVAAPGEEEMVGTVMDSVSTNGSLYAVADSGRHGASVLDVGAENWTTLATFLGHHTGGPPARTDVRMEGTDGVPVVADVYGEGTTRGWIALLHQGGGSARGEYGFLVPRLLDMGYGVVTPDLQGGGDRFGFPNRTLAISPESGDFSYCDALPQLRAVLDWTRTQAGALPVILWGSSYSASLAIHVAADDPPAATLAFSPASGDPMEGCRPETVAETFGGPLLVVRPEGEAAIPSVSEQLRRFAEAGHETWVASPGLHGSSTLNPLRVPALPAGAWDRARTFLERRGGA